MQKYLKETQVSNIQKNKKYLTIIIREIYYA